MRARTVAIGCRVALVSALTLPAALALPVAFALTALALPAFAAPDEEPKAESGVDSVTVTNKEGKQFVRKGEIQEETAAKVVLRLSDGKASTIKREEIVRVEYGGTPSALNEGDGKFNRGDFEGAASAYRRCADEIDGGKGRAIWKPRALLGAGRALLGAGKADAAGEAFALATKATSPSAIWVRDAYREAVRAYIRAKNAGKAVSLANEAGDAFKKAEFGGDAEDEAKLLKAEAQEANGQAGDARALFNVLTNSKDVKVRGRALLGAARTALAQKDPSRAESQFRAILDERDVERSVRCGAARGLADILREKPGAEKDFQKLRAVAAAYALATAVHSPARGEGTEDREAALHFGAKTYDLLADLCKDAKDAKGKELYKENAKAYREELVRLYPSSSYKDENQKALAAGDK